MFLQLATFLLAIQWLGAPWQLGAWKNILAVLFFLGMVVLSCVPTFFREYGNAKKRILFWAIGQIIVTLLGIFLPGIGTIINLIFQIVCLFMPITFIRKCGVGMLLFLVWFAGINYLLGLFILEDPRGIFSGDLYFSFMDWAILGVFILALARSIYHLAKNFPTFKLYNSKDYDISYVLELAFLSQPMLKDRLLSDINEIKNKAIEGGKQRLLSDVKTGELMKMSKTEIKDYLKTQAGKQIVQALDTKYGGAVRLLKSNTQKVNAELQEQEHKTFIPLVILSAVALLVTAFIPPLWKSDVLDQLKTAYSTIASNDIQAAEAIAENLYNDNKFFYNGDVFLLKGLLLQESSAQEAAEFFDKAGGWFDHHKSWISASHHGDAYLYLAQTYTKLPTPDYKKAKKAIDKAVKIEPLSNEYLGLQLEIDMELEKAKEEKANSPGFFKRLWNRITGKKDVDE
jgi:hypothetical protein